MASQSNSDFQTRLILRWLGALFLFYIVYDFVAGFMNALMSRSIDKSLILENVLFNGSYTVSLIIVVVAEFIVVGFIIKYLLMAFPSQLLVCRIMFVLGVFGILGKAGNKQLVDTPIHFASLLFLLATMRMLIITMRDINSYKNNIATD